MASLDLAMVGNARIAALIDTTARVSWMCVPAFDGDPVFCSLLSPPAGGGHWDIRLAGGPEHCAEQHYERNSAVLRSVLRDDAGNAIEILDFAPRFYQFGRMFAPVSLVRVVRRLAGRPRITMNFAPSIDYGAQAAPLAFGSHHVRVNVPSYPLRLTTDAPLTQLVEQRPFPVEDTLTFLFGPDETLQQSPKEAGRHLLEETLRYWRRWVRGLAVPFEWQDAVIRAAITLKLNSFEDTGAIVAAMTTSIPEAPHSARNWDYRYCWLRDAYFVVNALNRLGATGSLERYLRYIEGLVAEADGAPLQPVYSLTGRAELNESEVPALAGYRGMGPVRRGNLAYVQKQHDVYGSAILGVSHVFFDQRLERVGDRVLFEQLERLGERAVALHDVPDAGIWEFRGRQSVHTFSSAMCWAACDRLARIATRIGAPERAAHWLQQAQRVRSVIEARGFNHALGSFVAEFDRPGADAALDASLLVLSEVDFLPRDDARLRATVEAVERQLRRGDFLLRYDRADDFGLPETAFVVCTFWWVQALALIGERDRARAEFERLLARRNRFGLLSEDIDPATGELWGNFPQTYSMVGIVMCAMRLSSAWE